MGTLTAGKTSYEGQNPYQPLTQSTILKAAGRVKRARPGVGQFAVAALYGRRVGEGSAPLRERAALPYQRRRSGKQCLPSTAARKPN